MSALVNNLLATGLCIGIIGGGIATLVIMIRLLKD